MKKFMKVVLAIAVCTIFLSAMATGVYAADVKVDFEGTAGDGVTKLTNVDGIIFNEAGTGWASYVAYETMTSKYIYYNDGNVKTAETSFTIPAGKVLKSFFIGETANAPIEVILSSEGSEDVKINLEAKATKIVETGWTKASGVVTVKVNTTTYAWAPGFDDFVLSDAEESAASATTEATETAAAESTGTDASPKTADVGVLPYILTAAAASSGVFAMMKRKISQKV